MGISVHQALLRRVWNGCGVVVAAFASYCPPAPETRAFPSFLSFSSSFLLLVAASFVLCHFPSLVCLALFLYPWLTTPEPRCSTPKPDAAWDSVCVCVLMSGHLSVFLRSGRRSAVQTPLVALLNTTDPLLSTFLAPPSQGGVGHPRLTLIPTASVPACSTSMPSCPPDATATRAENTKVHRCAARAERSLISIALTTPLEPCRTRLGPQLTPRSSSSRVA